MFFASKILIKYAHCLLFIEAKNILPILGLVRFWNKIFEFCKELVTYIETRLLVSSLNKKYDSA
jgi:hypothetical protein